MAILGIGKKKDPVDKKGSSFLAEFFTKKDSENFRLLSDSRLKKLEVQFKVVENKLVYFLPNKQVAINQVYKSKLNVQFKVVELLDEKHEYTQTLAGEEHTIVLQQARITII